MEEKNSCETCKHFSIQCNNPKLTRGQKRKRYRLGDCLFWEQAAAVESEGEHQQTLEQALSDIAQQLSVIAALLKKN